MLRFLTFIAVVVISYSPHALSQPAKQSVANVIVTSVKKQEVFDQVEALGTLKANETITITSTVTEIATSVNFSDGQRVEAGDILVEMASGEEKAQLDQAQAVTEESRQQLNRAKSLAKDGVAAQSTLDQRQRDYTSAVGRQREIQSKLKNYLITAPFSGIVGLRNISVGALIQPGTKITTLDDDSVMKLDFSVPSIFLSNLKIGTPVVAEAREFPGQKFKGEIVSLDSQIDPVTRSIIVRAVLPNQDHLLKPGLLMSVRLLSNARQSIVIPEESIIPEGKEHYVWVVNNEQPAKIEKRKVIIGTRMPGLVEISSGLAEGERIVTHGTMTARAGQVANILAEEDGNEDLPSILKKIPESGQDKGKK